MKHSIKQYILPLIALGCIAANHIYMHYIVIDGTRLSAVWIYRAFTFLCFDVLSFLFVFAAVTLFRHRRLTYTFTWAFMLALDIANIVYSRFFHQYLSLNSLSEVSNLSGMWWTQYVMPACRVTDIIFLLTSIIFILVVWTPKSTTKYLNNQCWKGRFRWKKNIIAILVIVIPHSIITDAYNLHQHEFPRTLGSYMSSTQGDEFHRRVILEQKLYYCSYGLLRTELYFAFFYPSSDKTLSLEENQQILYFLKKNLQQPLYKNCFTLQEKYNVSLIIIESYISAVSDMSVNGIEVTPTLNKLRHSKGTYYNGNMSSSVALGESSDAQLMYFTGLLPLSSEITVASLSRKHLIALPSQMHSQRGFETYMTIPTKKFVWHQDEVNTSYGIDHLNSTLDDKDGFLGEDDEVFKLAMAKENSMQQPFLHVILTASMHSPYEHTKECTKKCPLKFPPEYSREYCNYLRACWFTDQQISKYIVYLKQQDRYNRTVLIITADHASHPELLKMSSKRLNECKIPLYIINANIHLPGGYDNDIEQIDVYSSMLDLFSIKNSWHGLGQSIFRPRHNINKKECSAVSDLIIQGDWLKKLSR